MARTIRTVIRSALAKASIERVLLLPAPYIAAGEWAPGRGGYRLRGVCCYTPLGRVRYWWAR